MTSTPATYDRLSPPVTALDMVISGFLAGHPVVLVPGAAGTSLPQLIAAADRVPVAAMAFTVRHTSGFIYVCLPVSRCNGLALPIFANDECVVHEPLPAVSVDAADGVGTGISAADRSITARRLANPSSTPGDFRRPGHVVPLRLPDDARTRGSLPAAALGLCRLAGIAEAAVMGDLVFDAGDVMTANDATLFAARHSLQCLTAADVFAAIA